MAKRDRIRIALGMHFNTRFHLRIKLLKELYTQIEAELSVYATLNKEKCNCVSFDSFDKRTWILLQWYCVRNSMKNRKLSWKRHAVYTEALWCVKLYTKFIYSVWWGRKAIHMTLMTTTTTKVLMLLCLILPTKINDTQFWLTIDELVFFTFRIITLQSFDVSYF